MARSHTAAIAMVEVLEDFISLRGKDQAQKTVEDKATMD